MGLSELVAASRRYGADERFVLAGGGNASYKDQDTLHIKASGTTLAELTEESMVRLSRKKLDAIWVQRYSNDTDIRESQALAGLMAAQLGSESKRPSVETLLHELLQQQYVIHLHPSLVNGLTCGRDGERIASELYPEDMLWIPVVNPGYVLASHIRTLLDSRLSAGGSQPKMLLLQNHGVFVASDSLEEIDRVYEDLMARLAQRLVRRPDMTLDPEAAKRVGPVETAVKAAFEHIGIADRLWSRSLAAVEINRVVASEEGFAPIASFGYTPDHLVYCKAAPLWLPAEEGEDADAVEERVKRYLEEHLVAPRIVAAEGRGAVAIGESESEVGNAAALFLDLLKVIVYAESFGGPQLMPKDKSDFILNWEVERYRARVSTGEE